MNIYFSKKQFLGFKGVHPDVNIRLKVILDYLEKSDLKYKLISPTPATEKQLLLAHDEKYINELKNPILLKKYFPEDPFSKGTFTILKLSSGAAINACEYSYKNKKFSFALTRPRGNFAGKDYFENYSYVNNMAVSVLNLLEKHPNLKVLIFDFDAHFCNGTYDILKDYKNIFIVSIHQMAESIFPYSGSESGSTSNIKIIENKMWITDEDFLEKVRTKILPYIDEVSPDILCISAGFNIYYKDIFYGTCSSITSPKTFKKLGKMLNVKSKEINAPVFAILEGGYWTEDLGELIYNFLKGFESSKKDLPEISDSNSKKSKGVKNAVLKKSKRKVSKPKNKSRK